MLIRRRHHRLVRGLRRRGRLAEIGQFLRASGAPPQRPGTSPCRTRQGFVPYPGLFGGLRHHHASRRAAASAQSIIRQARLRSVRSNERFSDIGRLMVSPTWLMRNGPTGGTYSGPYTYRHRAPRAVNVEPGGEFVGRAVGLPSASLDRSTCVPTYPVTEGLVAIASQQGPCLRKVCPQKGRELLMTSSIRPRWREAADEHHARKRASVCNHSPMMRARCSRSSGHVFGKT
jgi:hypothetical protein